MNTFNFPEANVWLALLWNRHADSERARAWFEQVDEEQFFFCRFTQITVLRLLTSEWVMGSDTKSLAEAWGLWDRIWADERVDLLAEPDDLEKDFRWRSRLTERSSKVWVDSYLLAFAAVAGLKFITFERGLQGRGAEVVVI
ncbi:MAG: PIN domain-containing protein [Terriglobales bacterium]